MSRDRVGTLTLLTTAVLILVCAASVYAFLQVGNPPHGDAAILLRYAVHLSQGFGIVWNIGERPVDGATDFLPMMMIAGLVRLGLSASAAAYSLGVASHLLTALLIYIALAKIERVDALASAVSVAYFFSGPGLRLISAGFTTPVFVLFSAATWLIALKMSNSPLPAKDRDAVLFSLLALLTGLTRPEGVFLAIFILLAIVYAKGFAASRRLAAIFVAVFGLLGGAYFIWHFRYFGHLLPNPFYKKGGWLLHWDGLRNAIIHVIFLSGPFGLAFVLGLRNRVTTRRAVFALIPIAGFTAIWVLLSDEMDYMMRFQYAVLPIIVMSWYPLVQGISKELRLDALVKQPELVRRVILQGAAPMLAVLVVLYMCRLDRKVDYNDTQGGYELGQALKKFGPNRVLATTEAGLVPFYSGWKTLDVWGLNDSYIAHDGLIDEEYLAAYAPAVIHLHGSVCPDQPEDFGLGQSWVETLRIVQAYALEHHYIVAAAYGSSPYDTAMFFVNPADPDAGAITNVIRAARFYDEQGRPMLNFASMLDGTSTCAGSR